MGGLGVGALSKEHRAYDGLLMYIVYTNARTKGEHRDAWCARGQWSLGDCVTSPRDSTMVGCAIQQLHQLRHSCVVCAINNYDICGGQTWGIGQTHSLLLHTKHPHTRQHTTAHHADTAAVQAAQPAQPGRMHTSAAVQHPKRRAMPVIVQHDQSQTASQRDSQVRSPTTACALIHPHAGPSTTRKKTSRHKWRSL